MLKLEIQNFGPIKEGSVILRPLTIIVGPNNIGKSYIAQLAYALSGTLRRGLFTPMKLWRSGQHKPFPKGVRKRLKELAKGDEYVDVSELPSSLKKYFSGVVADFSPHLGELITKEIERCFGSRLADLTRVGFKGDLNLSFSLLEYDSGEVPVYTVQTKFKLESESLKLVTPISEILTPDFDTVFPVSMDRFHNEESIRVFITAMVFENLATETFYFPASRTGILQGHKALTGSVLSNLPLFGLESIEIPKLSGVVADFIGALLRLDKKRGVEKISTIGRFLESTISEGDIDLGPSETRFEYPEIYYKFNGERIPLHRASSMVSELAPIILFLKYVIDDRALIIIEEPEAHLHPDSQRRFAQAIVKLVRAGVNILITTHSDFFVQQLSNFVMLSKTPEARSKLGYSHDDYLETKEVGAYLVCCDTGDGSVVKELKITQEEGIPDAQFAEITNALFDETINIQKLMEEQL